MISDFALFVFTTLAGAAAGAYVARAIAPLGGQKKTAATAFSVVCLAFLVISGIALLAHLQRPLLVISAFNNLGAGIAQEGVTTILFGIGVLVDCVVCLTRKESPRWLVIVVAALGVLMTITMGLTYVAFIGEPAWATTATIPFFVLGDLAMGAGMYLAFNGSTLGENRFKAYFVAVQVLAGISVGMLCAHFAGIGFDFVLVVVGLVIGPLASLVIALIAKEGNRGAMAYAACACAVVGMVIARYAYYAASLF